MSENALTARKKYTEYCAVTYPPSKNFDGLPPPSPEHTTSQNTGEKSTEAYHPVGAVASDCNHKAPPRRVTLETIELSWTM
jgi:hypothetical protein